MIAADGSTIGSHRPARNSVRPVHQSPANAAAAPKTAAQGPRHTARHAMTSAHTTSVDQRARELAGLMKWPDRRFSMNVAWISDPDILPASGTGNTSANPGAVVPTITILSRNAEGATAGFRPAFICCSA